VRRLVGIVATAALVVALVPRVVAAAAPGPAFDLSALLMQRVFGESSDARASFDAAYGDRASESPLRDLALDATAADRSDAFDREASNPTFAASHGIRVAAISTAAPFDLAQTIRATVLHSNLYFASPPSGDVAATSSDPMRADASFTTAAYQPVAPVTFVSPQSAAFSLGPLVRGAPPVVAAGSAMAFGESSAPAGSAGSSAVLPGAAQVGPLKFSTQVNGASLSAPSVGLNDAGAGAGANLDVRAGSRTLTFGVSSNYERLTRNDASGVAPAALSDGSSWQLPGADVPLAVPNYADVSRVSVGAGVAVPVLRGLTLNLDYAADRMFGGYGLPGVINLDTFDNSYGGKLTFAIPNTSSTLSISARQLHYEDSLITPNASTQTREDVNFTVKF